MSSNATPTTTTLPPPSSTPTTSQPPLPPPQTFDILPPLHALLSRLEPTLNVYTPDTSAALPPNNASSHTPVTSASALPSPTPQQLDYKDAATAAQFLKSRIRKAMAELGALADMHRGVGEQEEEIRGLESKIRRQREVLARLAALAEEGS
ncbi:hypothetical protein E4T48_08218 [Aureobasidium sp. EXF-10727]|nr:hypothetical protein E4T48_08218 [Aureobasidium sp. EXF-10727]